MLIRFYLFEPVAVSLNDIVSPFVSKIEVPILGEVKVLFVKVCVPVSVTSLLPKPMSIMSGLVPSFAEANTILHLYLYCYTITRS